MPEQLTIVSGAPGANVTYTVFAGHSVKLEVSTGVDSEAAVQGLNNHYFIIDPGNGNLELGDASDWNPKSPSNGQDNYAARRQVNFFGCTNFQLIGTGTGNLDNTNSNFKIHGGRGWVMNYFDVGCTDYKVSGVDWSKGGTNNTETNPENPGADQADLVVFGGLRSVIELCTFQHGGHINARFMGRSQIVQDNDFDGDWEGLTPDAHGTWMPISRSGNRCCGCYSGVQDDENTEAPPYGPVLYQRNIFRKAGSAGDERDNCASEINAQHMIVRLNYIWDCCDALFKSSTFPEFSSVGNQKIYNNTGYGNGRILDLRTVDVIAGMFHRVDFFNNILDQIAGAGVGQNVQFRRRATGEAADGFANGWKGGRYEANIAVMAASAPEGTDVTVEFRNFGGSIENYIWTTVDNTYPNEWKTSNVMGTSPTYQGNPASGARTKATFLPNGGIAQGTAVRHAQANGAGVASLSLVVDAGQSRVFCDGWGVAGVAGDWIKIGSGLPVQITSINYNSDTIDLAAARTWADNDAVILCLTTDGINFQEVNSIGAGQVGTIVVPPPSPGAPALSTRVVVLR